MDLLKYGNPIFATFQLAREGLDKPKLDTLYICTLFGNPNDLQQSWGRIQREYAGKKQPVVRVFVDSGISTCAKQGRDLKRFLRAMKYPFDVQEVEV
jgi:superfamily II DNA or RNA helicase